MNPLSRIMRCGVALALFCAFQREVIKGEALEKTEFVGSTPCELLTEQFLGALTTNSPYDKITWLLTLFSDQQTHLPQNYKLVATYGMQAQSAPGFAEGAKTVGLTGSWEIFKDPL